MIYEGRIILYVSTALTAIFLLAMLLHFYRTRARVYIYFAVVFLIGLVSCALQIAADRVSDDAFNGSPSNQSGSNAEFTKTSRLLKQLFDTSYVFGLFSQLLFQLGVLVQLHAWLLSMQMSLPSENRTVATVVVRIGYSVVSFATTEEICNILFSNTWSNDPLITIALYLEYAIIVLLLVIIVWLLVGLIRSSALHRSKKNQLWILMVLIAFSPPLQSFPMIISSVIWLIPRVLVVWPGVLVGFDKAPDAGYQHEVTVTKV